MSVAFDGSVPSFTLSFTFTVVSPVRIHTSELRMNTGSGRHAVVIQIQLIQLKFVFSFFMPRVHFQMSESCVSDLFGTLVFFVLSSLGMPGCDEDQLQKGAFSVLHVLLETFIRLVLPYQEFPWRLVGLVDPRLSSQDKQTIVADFMALPLESLDFGFSQRLRSALTSGEELMEGGSFHELILLLSSGKVINVEIEDNFARAAAMRRAGAGRSYSQHASAAKHVLAELRARHQASVAKSFKSTKKSNHLKPRKTNSKSKSKRITVELLQEHSDKCKFFDKGQVDSLSFLNTSSQLLNQEQLALPAPSGRFVWRFPSVGGSGEQALQLFAASDSLDSEKANPIEYDGLSEPIDAKPEREPQKHRTLYNGWTLFRKECIDREQPQLGDKPGERFKRAVAKAKQEWQACWFVFRCFASFIFCFCRSMHCAFSQVEGNRQKEGPVASTSYHESYHHKSYHTYHIISYHILSYHISYFISYHIISISFHIIIQIHNHIISYH